MSDDFETEDLREPILRKQAEAGKKAKLYSFIGIVAGLGGVVFSIILFINTFDLKIYDIKILREIGLLNLQKVGIAIIIFLIFVLFKYRKARDKVVQVTPIHTTYYESIIEEARPSESPRRNEVTIHQLLAVELEEEQEEDEEERELEQLLTFELEEEQEEDEEERELEQFLSFELEEEQEEDEEE